jgi:branched-chain amino acid transport system substrate-binding protein
MKLSKHFFAILSVVFLLFITACSGNTTSSNESESGKKGSNESAEPAKDVKTVSIGYTGPLSGPAAYYGEATLSGLEMAAKEINDAGGFDVNGQTYTIDLVALDDKYLPNESGSNAKRLIQENNTPVIFTPHSGGVFALQVFNEQDEFLLMAYTSEPKITEVGNSLTVRIPPRYDGYKQPFTDYQMERFGKKLAALPTASQYGKDWTETLLPYWEENGGEVVYNSAIDFSKDTDFFTILTNALKEEPDVLFIGGPSQPTAKVAKQARDLGFEGGFMIMDQAKLDEMSVVTGGYDVLEGSIGVMPLQNSNYPGTSEFLEKYKAADNKTAGSEAAWNYIGMYAVIEAMKAAGTVDDAKAIREKMEEGVKAIPEEKQVYVVTDVGEDGGFEVDLEVAAVEDGKIVPIKVGK